jgi:RHS repeat-associated protein
MGMGTIIMKACQGHWLKKAERALMQWLVLSVLLLSTHAFAQSTGSVTYVYTDPQGTPLAEADASGNITATFEYTPYGTYAPTGTSNPGPTPNGPGYTGHVNDPETDLVYMQARYYDPVTGRFLGTDPTPPTSGNSFSFNRFVYASNNPIGNVDPDGKQSTFDAAIWQNEARLVQSQNPKAVQQAAEINAAQAKMVVASALAVVAAPAVGYVGGTAVAVASDAAATGSATAGVMLNLTRVIVSTSIVADAVAGANGAPSQFEPEALVVRGGGAANQTAAKIDAAIGPSRTPGITGFSCQCNGGTDLGALGSALYNKQLGVTTVGEIQQAGGSVVATPGGGFHVTVTDLNGTSASPLFSNIVKNPNPKPPLQQ